MKALINILNRHLKNAGKLTLISATGWLVVVTVTSVIGISSLLLQATTQPDTAASDAVNELVAAHSGWGVEAIDIVKSQAQQFSPVALANACGLGASSCFRCHNGKRAALPESTPDIAPWHHQHAKVNYSCTGCHQGNPRILKQEIAHKNLVVNPLTVPEKTCGSCHAAGEVKDLADTWRTISPRLFEHLE